jgi:dipeptidyl aminopeptidase/acylaminoacyl peptidase
MRIGLCLLTVMLISTSNSVSGRADDLPTLKKTLTVSMLDGEQQNVLYWAPAEAETTATPLFVFLHSRSGDYRQDNSKWLADCARHGWIWLHPDFRGINQTPKACGSRFARQDILDAIDWGCTNFKVDRERIYLAGVSGGGHMSLLMAGHHPNRFSAVSAWVGPTDLAEWHRFHSKDGKPQKYAQMIEKSLGGSPDASPEIAADYRDRSPVFHLHQATELPVSIWAGVQDGHTGSVPIRHSLRCFNAIAQARGTPCITDDEVQQLSVDRKLTKPQTGDQYFDKTLDREVFLRRQTGDSMITIFDGGHESMPTAAFAWLEQQRHQAQ